MQKARLLGSLAIVVAAITSSPEARAADDPSAKPVSSADAQAEARKAMERGIAAKERGDHEAALAEYRRAAELVPEANLPHRFAGEALEKLARWDEAIASYETYLRIKANVQDAASIRARIDEIRTKHVEGVLDVECAPEGAEVTIDGAAVPAGNTPLRGQRVRAGAHTIVVHAQGYKDGTWQVQVAAGATRALQCSLDRVGGNPQSPDRAGPVDSGFGPSPPAKKPEAERGVFGTWWFWTGLGVLVASAGITAFVLTRKSDDAPPHTDGGTLRFP